MRHEEKIMVSKRFLSLTLIALSSTTLDVVLLGLFYRFSPGNFRAEHFLLSPFWIIMMPIGLLCAMVSIPAIVESCDLQRAHLLEHIVRMNIVLFLVIAPLTRVILPNLSWDDWYTAITLLLFLMIVTTFLWEWVYRRMETN